MGLMFGPTLKLLADVCSWHVDCSPASIAVKTPLLPLVLIIALNACASSPTQITSRDPRSGNQDRYYASSDFCGHLLETEQGFAVFAVEKGTSLGGNRLLVWLYNLQSTVLNIRVHSFSYHGSRIFVRKNMTVGPGSKIKILDQSVAFEAFGADNALSYSLTVGASRAIGLIELRHQTHPDPSVARRACKPPESVAGF